MMPTTEPRISRFHLQTILTNTTVIKNLQAIYAIDPNRFNKDRIPEACDFLLSSTPSLHTRIFMYYSNQETPKLTFSAEEIQEVVITDSTIEDSIKKEILCISALQMGVELEELYPKHPSFLKKFLMDVRKKRKRKSVEPYFKNVKLSCKRVCFIKTADRTKTETHRDFVFPRNLRIKRRVRIASPIV